MLFSQLFTTALLGAATVSAKYIVPGARWRDTNGDLVNAHAGGVTVDKNGTFWWFGEYKVQGQEEGGGVSVYSSEDLATWTHHGFALGMFGTLQLLSREIRCGQRTELIISSVYRTN